jgi:O-antigen ligase
MLIAPIQDRLLNLTDAKVFWNYGFAANSYEWRQILWESAWNWISPSNIVFGNGLGSFLKFSPTFFPLSGGIEFGAHNVYLQLLFEEGVIGVASFIWLFGGLLLAIYRDRVTEKLAIFIVLALLAQYLVAGYSDNMLDYLSFNWNLWFLCGTAYSIASVNHSLDGTKSNSKTDTRFRIKLHRG